MITVQKDYEDNFSGILIKLLNLNRIDSADKK